MTKVSNFHLEKLVESVTQDVTTHKHGHFYRDTFRQTDTHTVGNPFRDTQIGHVHMLG